MPQKQKNWLIAALVVVLVVAGAGWYFWSTRVKVTTYAKETVMNGDYTVGAKQKIVLQAASELIVKGNLNLDGGELACDSGPLKVTVEGTLNVKGGTFSCAGINGNVAIVAMGSVNFDKNTKIVAEGPVQIVASKNNLASTHDDFERLYANAATPDGKIRVGPFLEHEAGAPAAASASKDEPLFAVHKDSPAPAAPAAGFGIPVAQAQAEAVINIAGKIVIPTPAKENRRPLVVFNFPGVNDVNIQNLDLQGPDGRPGDDDNDQSCNARGKDGENALRFLARAGSLKVGDFTLTLGNGGKGGDAATKTDCYPLGTAKGGKGGNSGNFKMVAENNFEINGTFTINPGHGGDGGAATAYGKNGEPGQKGGDAAATGGVGLDNIKTLGLNGTVQGLDNVQVGSLIGGKGGDAKANPGAGGAGQGCGKKGGDGGKGMATGGVGGNARATLTPGTLRSPGAEDTGGKGGDANSFGAVGGDGGDGCGPEGPGGDGGKGGDAKSTPGKGGSATNNGADGANAMERGGKGGDGGDGCGPGAGGKGGNGNPKGEDGKPGQKTCVVKGKPGAQVVPGGGTNTSATVEIEVISYKGKYIPVSELMIEEHSGCDGAPHWHSKPRSGGPVKATDGSTVIDPGPDCGFGKVSQVPKMKIQVSQ